MWITGQYAHQLHRRPFRLAAMVPTLKPPIRSLS